MVNCLLLECCLRLLLFDMAAVAVVAVVEGDNYFDHLLDNS
jgi:hypothetical protein